MKISINWHVLVVFATAIILTACGGADTPAPAMDHEHPNPPAEYAGLALPEGSDASAGETIFQANCAACHGERGEGDGPASAALNPAPRNLVQNQMAMSDAYLFWRIAEGGMMEPFKSSMPSWKGVLSDAQIWSTIAYIRSLAQ